MQKVTRRQNAVLDVLDEQIADLEEKLQKAQPLFDELNKLKKTRAVLLSERTVTGGVGSNTRLTMEEVIHTLRENGNGDGMTPNAIADKLGVDVNTVRSHLNRHKDERYTKNGDGTWDLIGEGDDD
jgi:hypothetical protein